MLDRISIVGLEVHGRHGVYPAERLAGQRFLVDLTIHRDLRSAGATDELTASIDYEQVAQLVNVVVGSEQWNLIERVATRVAEEILANFPGAETVEVTVHKPDAPMTVAFTDVAVTILRSR